MTASTPRSARLRLAVDDLCDVLQRLRDLHVSLLDILATKERALVEVRLDDLERLRTEEEVILRDVIQEEKERLLITEEIGDLLDHDRPVSIRVAEILPHLEEDMARRLSGERERLRETAVRLARQNSLNRALIEHSIEHIQIFFSRVAADEGGARYDQRGSSSASGGGPFLMDRRV